MATEPVEPLDDAPPGEAGGGGVSLPVDPRAIALGLWRLRWVMAGLVAVAVVAGLAAGKLLASRVYTAETIMLYQPPPVDSPEAASMPSLNTLLDMVKLPSNLEALAEELGLDVETRALGGATTVELRPKTSLVVIRAKWDNARLASDIANGLRETFLETQSRLRREDAEARIRDVEGRLGLVNGELAAAEEALRDFTSSNRVVHLSEEARNLLEELANVNLLYEQARVRQRAVEIQAESAARIIAQLQQEMAAEQATQAAMSDAMSETNIRIQRLRESIMDDKDARYNAALLEEARLRMERAQASHAAGAMSQQELDEAVAEYRALEARAVDTPQIEAWRKEMEELDQKVIPSGGAGGTLTGNLLKDVMFRDFELRLQLTTVGEEVASLEEARKRVDDRLARLPDLQRTHATLTRDVSVLEAEKASLEARLAEARRLLAAAALPFSLVSAAEPPPRSSSSNAKKIALGVAFLLCAPGLGLCLGVVLLDPRVRTATELGIALKGVAVLGETRDNPAGLPPPPELPETEAEQFRAIARALRTVAPARGARVLFTSPGHAEGTSTALLHVAAVLGRWGESVLVVDAHLRGQEEAAGEEPAPASRSRLTAIAQATRLGVEPRRAGASPLARLLLEDAGPGFAALLGDESMTLARAVRATTLANVSWIMPSPGPASPDLLATPRFRELLEQAAREHSVVLVDGPPSIGSVDAENISLAVDAVVLVVRAQGPFGMAARAAAQPFARSGCPVAGAILSRARPPYASSSAPSK